MSEIGGERRARLETRLQKWGQRLQQTGLDGLIDAMLGAAAPFGVLGAQMLWVAQPALSSLMPRDTIEDLAHVLSEPGGMGWLREQLTGSEDS